eukprot:496797-Hanusia_phi.AAC.1
MHTQISEEVRGCICKQTHGSCRYIAAARPRNDRTAVLANGEFLYRGRHSYLAGLELLDLCHLPSQEAIIGYLSSDLAFFADKLGQAIFFATHIAWACAHDAAAGLVGGSEVFDGGRLESVITSGKEAT